MKRYEPDISCGVAFSDVAIMTERKTGEYVEYTDAMKAAERTPLERASPDLLKAVRAWDAAFRSFCGDPDMFLDTFDSARSLSRSAIAKAESEATDVGR